MGAKGHAPSFKGMATNRLNSASSCITGYHFRSEFISPEGQRHCMESLHAELARPALSKRSFPHGNLRFAVAS